MWTSYAACLLPAMLYIIIIIIIIIITITIIAGFDFVMCFRILPFVGEVSKNDILYWSCFALEVSFFYHLS